ncbi:MAG: hypothetical protein HOP11_11655 [Saprospiraceae bacterium]|nr:hypothetical protein [Saprospiraceae bacterium]
MITILIFINLLNESTYQDMAFIFNIGIYAFSLGGSVILLLYHITLYWQYKDNLLRSFCFYLFSLSVLLIFRFYILDTKGFESTSMNISAIKISEFLEMIMYFGYIKYVTDAIDFDKSKYSKLTTSINIVLTIILIYAAFSLFLGPNSFIELNSLGIIVRVLIFSLAIILFFQSFNITDNAILIYIQIGAGFYFMLSLISFLMTFVMFNIGLIRPIHVLLVGTLIDLIIFSLAMAKRNKLQIINAEKSLSLRELELQNYKFKQELAIKEQKEKDRKSIAMDLHDDLGSSISSIRFAIESAKNSTESEYFNALDKIEKVSSRSMDKISEMIWTLKSEDTYIETLEDRIRNYLYEISGICAVDFSIHCDSKLKLLNLNLNARKNIWLIIKEGITNICKHSKAKSARISIENQDTLKIILEDDGIGFPEQIRKDRNGLENLKVRTEELSGIMTMDNSKTGGALLIFEFDIPKIRD